MKVNWNLISMFILSIFTFGVMMNSVSASASGDEDFNDGLEEYTELGPEVKVEGELSEVEYDLEVGMKCIVCGVPKYNIIKKSSPTKQKRFVRYLTGSWAKSDRYTWNKNQSASSTLSSDIGVTSSGVSSSLGVSNTVKTTYGVTVSIPANKSKLSKLGFYSDFNRRLITTQFSSYPHTVKSAYHYAPLKDTYLQVVYK